MSVRQCQAQIDSAEFEEWRAFDKVDPFGNWRGDLQAGIVASAAARHGSPFHFIPKFIRDEPSPVELKQKIKASLAVARASGRASKSRKSRKKKRHG